MCIGGNFFKKILPVLALGASIYLGGSSLFGSLGGASGAAGGAGQGAAGLLGSTASSAVPAAAAATTAGTGGIGSFLSNGLGFIKDNSFWLGQGANALGVVSKNIGYNQQQNEFNRAIQDNNQKNALISGQATGINNQSLANLSLDNQNAALNEAANMRMAANEATQAPPESIYLPSAGSAPQDVKSTLARVVNDKIVEGRKTQAAGANLYAQNDVSLGNSLAINDSAIKLNQLGGFTQGNNNVLDGSLKSITNQPRAALTIGDALQGIGSVANAYSVTRPKAKKAKAIAWPSDIFADKGYA